jgi:hypothetical protein
MLRTNFSINRLAEGDVRAHDAQLLKATVQQFSELTNQRSAQYRTLHRTRCKLNELMKRNLKDAPLRRWCRRASDRCGWYCQARNKVGLGIPQGTVETPPSCRPSGIGGNGVDLTQPRFYAVGRKQSVARAIIAQVNSQQDEGVNFSTSSDNLRP